MTTIPTTDSILPNDKEDATQSTWTNAAHGRNIQEDSK